MYNAQYSLSDGPRDTKYGISSLGGTVLENAQFVRWLVGLDSARLIETLLLRKGILLT